MTARTCKQCGKAISWPPNDAGCQCAGLGRCDVRGCKESASVEWPMLGRRLCSKHNKPKYAPAGAFDPPDDFDIPW